MSETRNVYVIDNPFAERITELKAYHGKRKTVKNSGCFTFFVTETLVGSAIVVERTCRENF